MKIGILTQPLTNNYGGIIQAYALISILKRFGHEVRIVNRPFKPVSKIRKVVSFTKRWLVKYILRRDIIVRVWPTNAEKNYIEKNLTRFIENNIRFTEKINNSGFSKLQKYALEAFIVGSDQVWRPNYSPCIRNYFLDFLYGRNDVKKIAYAASFGVNDWELSPKQTKLCAILAKQFDAISVREDSAIRLCNEYLGVEAIHVLDPALLLQKEDYLRLIEPEDIPRRENILFTYILNPNKEKDMQITYISSLLTLNKVNGMPSNFFHLKKSKKDLADCIYPSVSDWLSGFRDAEFVITDSFHGTVFSIIFNKPFLVFTNKERGNARFDSLLKLFHLEDRLITGNEIKPDLYKLDFSEVNKILKEEQEKSMKFLIRALNC
jgi:hypothetical protein